MTKKKEPLQFGNFTVTKESGNEHDWISIKAVSGFWTMRFRDDNEMYGRIRLLANNKKYSEYIDSWIKICYLISNCTPDVEFMKDFFEAYSSMSDRIAARQTQLSEEEDKAILEQDKAFYEIKEQIEKGNDGGAD